MGRILVDSGGTPFTLGGEMSTLKLAFQGAEGWNAGDSNWRLWAGGEIRHVDTLASGGSGSFKDAVETSGAALIVFDVAGYSDHMNNVAISSCKRIAGQTAPGDTGGFIWRGANLWFTGDYIICEHLRMLGTAWLDVNTGMSARDAASIGRGHTWLHHCTAAGGTDGALDINNYGAGARGPVNLQDCIVAESQWDVLGAHPDRHVVGQVVATANGDSTCNATITTPSGHSVEITGTPAYHLVITAPKAGGGTLTATCTDTATFTGDDVVSGTWTSATQVFDITWNGTEDSSGDITADYWHGAAKDNPFARTMLITTGTAGVDTYEGIHLHRSLICGGTIRHPSMQAEFQHDILFTNLWTAATSRPDSPANNVYTLTLYGHASPQVFRLSRIACVDRHGVNNSSGCYIRMGDDGFTFVTGTEIYVPTINASQVTNATAHGGSQVLDENYGNDIKWDGTNPQNAIYWEGYDTYSVNHALTEVLTPPFPLPYGVTLLRTADVETYLRRYVGARPRDRLSTVETRLIDKWIKDPANSDVFDDWEADSGETPNPSARYATESGEYGTGFPTVSGSATWQDASARWGVGNWDLVPGTPYYQIEKALWLDHLAVGGHQERPGTDYGILILPVTLAGTGTVT